MTVFQFLMRPSNLVCDRLGLADEHERGMMRMLVNMGFCTAICVVAGYVAWEIIM